MIVKAVMVPHPPIALHEVGRGEESKIQDTLDAFHKAAKEIAETKPETVIVLSPHAVMYRDWFQISSGNNAYGNMSRFGARSVSFQKEYDTELTSLLDQMLEKDGIPGGTDYDRMPGLDHGTMVPLYFLDQEYTDYRLVRIGLSGMPLTMHYRLGMKIAEAAQELNRKIAVIGSGDLSHCQKEDGPYGFDPAGPEYDERIMKTMGSADFGELFAYPPSFLEKAQECGHRSFVIMAGIFDGLSVTPHVYSHEATFGVGYGIVTYDIGAPDENRHFLSVYEKEEKDRIRKEAENSDIYASLARKAVLYAVRHHRVLPLPGNLPSVLKEKKAGVFVSLHIQGELRGCIGTISPVTACVGEEICRNALSAALKDPRFPPVSESELEWLEISTDVLGEPEVIPDSSMLDVKRYGVICRCNERTGLLLPDLEGVDTVEEQISIACRKGGIDPDDEDLILERFEVVRHV